MLLLSIVISFLNSICFVTQFEELRAERLFESEASIAICKSISAANYTELQRLLQIGVDPNLQSKSGLTVLHWAWLAGESKAFEILLEAGADPHLLLSEKIDVVVESQPITLAAGSSMLGIAMEFARLRLEFVELALRYMQQPNQRDKHGNTILHSLTLGHSYRFTIWHTPKQEIWIGVPDSPIVLMLNGGVDVNAVSGDGLTPARVLIRKTVHHLEHFNALSGARSQVGGTTMNTLQLLVDHGADLDRAASDGSKLINDFELSAGHDTGMEYLKKEIQANRLKRQPIRETEGFRPHIFLNLIKQKEAEEYFLTLGGPKSFLEDLKESKFDPNITGEAGFTYLWFTYLAGRIDEFNALLNANANPDIRLTDKLWAHRRTLKDIFNENLKHGIATPDQSPMNDFDDATNYLEGADFLPDAGDTVLMAECLNPFVRKIFVPPTLAATKNPNLRDELGRNLFHRLLYYPLRKDEEFLVEELIRAKVDVNAQSMFGSTPCHVAVRMNPSAIPTLVDAGANLTLRDIRGQTVLDVLRIAIENGWARSDECKQVLERLLAN